MKIFLDFDDTIFNTANFKTELKNIFFQFGIAPEEFEATYLDYPQKKSVGLKVYNPENQIKKLERLKKRSLEKVESRVEFFLKDLSRFVFEDFYFFVQKFSRAELFLVSFGDSVFQRKKIAASGVEKYFKKIFVTNGSKGKIIQKEVEKTPIEKTANKKEKVIFIDDRIDQLEEVKRENSKIILIRMKRTEGRFGELKGNLLLGKDFLEVKDFWQAERVIKKNFKIKALGVVDERVARG